MVADYFRDHVRYQPLDSVNIVFQGLDGSNGLLNAVLSVLYSAGWRRDRQDHEYLLEFDNSFRYEEDWRTLGPLWRRYHIRFWWGDSEILASAHKERIRKWPPGHEVQSFEDAKQRIEDTFAQNGWQVMHDSRKIGEPIQMPAANGWASIIVYP